MEEKKIEELIRIQKKKERRKERFGMKIYLWILDFNKIKGRKKNTYKINERFGKKI